MTIYYAGVDPGLHGAVGFVRGDGSFAGVVDMPIVLQSNQRYAVDAGALADVFRRHVPSFVLVERVGARPGEGATGAFSFGYTFGSIIAVLSTLGVAHGLVQPASWKRKAGIPVGADKDVSIATAKALLPPAAAMLTLKKHDGRAEALLIARQAWERASG